MELKTYISRDGFELTRHLAVKSYLYRNDDEIGHRHLPARIDIILTAMAMKGAYEEAKRWVCVCRDE